MGVLPADPATIATATARAHLAFVEAFRTLGRHAPDGAVLEWDGVTATASGLAEPQFNRLFVMAPVAHPQVVLARAKEFFAGLGLPWCIVATAEAAVGIEPFVRKAGFRLGYPVPLMVLPAIPESGKELPGLEIRQVRDGREAAVFVRTMERGFESRPGIFEVFATPGIWSAEGAGYYVGYAAGEPVATACCVGYAGSAGIFNVSTVPAHRRRGVGEAMTWHAIRAAAAWGCSSSSLQATRMGMPVYARMGFEHVANYAVWYAS